MLLIKKLNTTIQFGISERSGEMGRLDAGAGNLCHWLKKKIQ